MPQPLTQSDRKNMIVEIRLFGKFDILFNGASIIDASVKNQKSLDILRFLLINCGAPFDPEHIVSYVWPQGGYPDAKNVIRTYMFRLKKFLSVDNAIAQDITKYISIASSKGEYTINISDQCSLDVREFERSLEHIEQMKDDAAKEDCYLAALEAYRGHFLSDYNNEWITPYRRYYAAVYAKAVNSLLEMMSSRNENENIIKVCDDSFKKIGYEGKINTYYIQALLKLEMFSEAIDYYNVFAERSHLDVGGGQSDELEKIYVKIKASMNDAAHKGKNPLNERRFWQMMHNLLETYSNSNTADISVGYAVIVPTPGRALSRVEIFSAYESLTKSLDIVLRKDDVFTLFDNAGAVFILKYIDVNFYKTIIERITEMFTVHCKLPVELKVYINPLIPRQNL